MITAVETKLGTCYIVTDNFTKEVVLKTYLEYTALMFENLHSTEKKNETKDSD